MKKLAFKLRRSATIRTACARASHVHLDKPVGQVIDNLVEFSGWIRTRADLAAVCFTIDDEVQQGVRFHSRPDVPHETGEQVFGWSFINETGSGCKSEQGVIIFRVIENGVSIVRIFYRLRASKAPILLMMHIPKTGGTSLRMAIDNIFPPDKVLAVYEGSDRYCSIDDIVALSPNALDDLDVLFGHFAYGIHKHTSRAYKYITFVRNPYKYLESYIFFMRHVLKDPRFAGSIFDVLETVNVTELDNCYTRFFSGRIDANPVNEVDLKFALDNLKSEFAFVGDLDRVSESINLLSEYLGRDFVLETFNKTPIIDERTQLDLGLFYAAAAPRLQYDLRLYSAIAEIFWDRLPTAEKVKP